MIQLIHYKECKDNPKKANTFLMMMAENHQKIQETNKPKL